MINAITTKIRNIFSAQKRNTQNAVTIMPENIIPFSFYGLDGTWKIRKKASVTSANGWVYNMMNRDTLEKATVKFVRPYSASLVNEYNICKQIHSGSDPKLIIGIPRVIHFQSSKEGQLLVMPLPAPSLQDIFQKYGNFSLKATLMAGLQALKRLELIHGLGIAHGNINPENLALGHECSDTVQLIGFGEAYNFIDMITKLHIKRGSPSYGVKGTMLFKSRWAQRGCLQSRRDDLMSLGYVMVFLFKGLLPWSGSDSQQTTDMKNDFPLQDLTVGMPTELLHYFEEVGTIGFEEKPNYLLLKRLLNKALRSLGHSART